MSSGEAQFRQAVRAFAKKPDSGEMPKPGSAWEAWVEYRIRRLEDGQTWLMRVILGALVVQVGLEVIRMVIS